VERKLCELLDLVVGAVEASEAVTPLERRP